VSGFVDGIGYLGGIMAGDSMARILVSYGWKGAFLVLAVVAIFSTAAAVLFLLEQLRMRCDQGCGQCTLRRRSRRGGCH